jgi:hypothetical protein
LYSHCTLVSGKYYRGRRKEGINKTKEFELLLTKKADKSLHLQFENHA